MGKYISPGNVSPLGFGKLIERILRNGKQRKI
jgi:hypothetical protein